MKKPSSLKVLSVAILAAGLLLSGCGTTSVASSQAASASSASASSSKAGSSSSSQAGVSSSNSSGNSSQTSSSSAESSSTAGSSSSVKQAVVVTLTGGTSVVMGKTLTLTAAVANADDTSVTWTSSDATIATIEDGVVTGVNPGSSVITATSVADSSKSASLTISVLDKYALRITGNGEYVAEAEDMDFTNATLRSDLAAAGMGFIEQPSGDAAATTSGGSSVRGVVSPSTFDILFYSAKAAVVDFEGRFANYDAGFVLDNNVSFSIDGTSIGATKAVFGGHSAPADYWPWQDIELTKIILPAGEHTLHIDVIGSLPNTDCFKFITSDYDDTNKYYVVSGDGLTTAEAEDLDLTNLVIRPDLAAAGRTKDSLIESATDASNGKSLGGIGAGTVLTVNLYFEDEAVVDVVARMADYGDTYDVDSNLSFKFDDEGLTSNGYNTFGHTDENLYWNWKDVDLGKVTINKGFHTFTYTAIGNGINLDCFKFTSSYYGDVSAAGTQLNGNGTTTLEAEALSVVTGSYSVEAPTSSSPVTNGGESICNVAVGTVFSIPFTLGDKATVSVVLRMAKYEEGWNLDSNVTIQIDGETLTTGYAGFGHTDDNQYWNWQDITVERALMAKGSHTLTLTATAGFPNMDSLSFVVAGYGDTFSAATLGTYVVEGESVDTSHLTTDGSASLIETDSRDSDGKSLGHINGGYFEIPFYLEMAAEVTIDCVISKYEPVVIGDSYSVYLDGTQTTFADPAMTLGRASDGSNDWFNWKDCLLTQQSLAVGEHVFKFALTSAGVNVDDIQFALTGIDF